MTLAAGLDAGLDLDVGAGGIGCLAALVDL